VLDGGLMTTVQDHPGRTGLWHVGVPPSGGMDSLSLQCANALLGNGASAAALEVTLSGPTLQFHRAAAIAVCGGMFPVLVDGAPVPMWEVVLVPKGAVLKLGATQGGARCYIAVDGGFDAPVYLGSRSTFPAGNFGGYQGRPLKVRSLHAASVARLHTHRQRCCMMSHDAVAGRPRHRLCAIKCMVDGQPEAHTCPDTSAGALCLLYLVMVHACESVILCMSVLACVPPLAER
jgi:allophanate hydrolase subunit 2